MLFQQKSASKQTSFLEGATLSIMNRINQETSDLKVLVQSLRGRSLRSDDSSLNNDSDLSKIEVKSDNKNISVHDSLLHQIHSHRPFIGTDKAKDFGDTNLTWKKNHPNHHQNINELLQTTTTQFKKQNLLTPNYRPKQSNLHFHNEVIARFDKNLIASPNIQQSTKKPQIIQSITAKELASQPQTQNHDKKKSIFRIKSKNEHLKIKQPHKIKNQHQNNSASHRKHHISNPETEPFQIETLNCKNLSIFLQQQQKKLNLNSSPDQIYDFFSQIYQYLKIQPINESLIKRYKNCVYFGQKMEKETKQIYKGMVYYFKKTFYYGEFVQGKKNGYGVEIGYGNKVSIWKGNFFNGSKTGYFQFQNPELKYYGMLFNQIFHGEGNLITIQSNYQGNFNNGLKEGYGLQKFKNKSEFKGEYFQGNFDGDGELNALNYHYKGLFKEGVPDGYGYERTNQYEYLGEFKNGKKSGKGRLKTAQETIQCQFKNGIIVEDPAEGKHAKPIRNNQIMLKYQSKELQALNEESQEATVQHMLSELNLQTKQQSESEYLLQPDQQYPLAFKLYSH